MRYFWICTCILLLTLSAAGAKKYKLVEIRTNLGMIKVKLYEDTPLHSENFLKLAAGHHYDSLLFHRVIRDFMIQGGASDSRRAVRGKPIGTSDAGSTIEAEIRPGHAHIKGALAAARQGNEVNPERRSSAEQFYIVQGKTYTDEQLDQIEKQKLYTAKNKLGAQLYRKVEKEHRHYLKTGARHKADSLIQDINVQIDKQFAGQEQSLFPPEVREMYKSVGGAPFLDGEYTVFGEVVEGLDIIDKIAAVVTDRYDRPEEDVVILEMKLKRK